MASKRLLLTSSLVLAVPMLSGCAPGPYAEEVADCKKTVLNGWLSSESADFTKAKYWQAEGWEYVDGFVDDYDETGQASTKNYSCGRPIGTSDWTIIVDG